MPEEKDVVTLMHEKEVNEDFDDWTHGKLKLKSKHNTANWSEFDKKICMAKGSLAIKYFFESKEVSRYIIPSPDCTYRLFVSCLYRLYLTRIVAVSRWISTSLRKLGWTQRSFKRLWQRSSGFT